MALVTSQGGLNKAKVNEQRGQIIAGLQKAGLRKDINLGDIDFGSMAENYAVSKGVVVVVWHILSSCMP